MASEEEHVHVFVFPLMAAGHLLPATDIAILLSQQGLKASILVTSGNIAAVQTAVSAFPYTHGSIHVLDMEPSPSSLPLPQNLSSATSFEMEMDFIVGTSLLRPSFERLVDLHRPTAIISDGFYPWTFEIAERYRIPRIVFHGTSLFSDCVGNELHINNTFLNEDPFIVPGVPHKIELSRSQLPNPREIKPAIKELFAAMREADERSYGLVVNSFYELEPDYVDHYRKKKKAWPIGPIFLQLKSVISMEESLLKWLEVKPKSSVLYVSFGSLCRFTEKQLGEIAEGLELSGCSFVWVVRKVGERKQNLPEGFEERVSERGLGLVVNGWAPQLAILNHVSVGGFLTHCGWNSCLESVSAGVPMVTWPMFAEQFYNERFLVDVLKVGLSVGAKNYSFTEEGRELVEGKDIALAVKRLMSDGEEAKEMRERATELSRAARRAVEEGGSSQKDLGSLIQALRFP